jgi:hypothetical protein
MPGMRDGGTLCLAVLEDVTLRVSSDWGVPSCRRSQSCSNDLCGDFDPSQYGEADRRAVDPPIEVEAATWSAAGTLDWWVKSACSGRAGTRS